MCRSLSNIRYSFRLETGLFFPLIGWDFRVNVIENFSKSPYKLFKMIVKSVFAIGEGCQGVFAEYQFNDAAISYPNDLEFTDNCFSKMVFKQYCLGKFFVALSFTTSLLSRKESWGWVSNFSSVHLICSSVCSEFFVTASLLSLRNLAYKVRLLTPDDSLKRLILYGVSEQSVSCRTFMTSWTYVEMSRKFP